MVFGMIVGVPRAGHPGWLACTLALACKPLTPEVWSADGGTTEASHLPAALPSPGLATALDAEQQIAADYPIVFSSTRSPPLFVLLQLHLASADGRAVRRVSTLAHVRQPVWAPDARSIAFVWADVWAMDDRLGNGLYLVTPSGSETLTLIEQRHDIDLSDPCWAPEGDRVVFTAAERDQPRHVWIISRFGGQPQRLLPDLEEEHWGAAWNRRDPSRIALLIDTDGDVDISVVNLRRPEVRQRLGVGFGMGLTRLSDLRWSPDGARLAFSASPEADAGEDGNREIYVVDVNTGELQRVTENAAVDRFPAWLADGKSLLIASDRQRTPPDTERDLWWTPLDGSAEPRLFLGNGTNAWDDIYWPPASPREP